MREPSLHIGYSTFIYLLEKYGVNMTKTQVKKFMQEARGYAIPHRGFVVQPSQAKKVEARTSSPLRDANLLANTIYLVRTKLNHFGISKIKQSDQQWSEIVQLVPLVNEFCDLHKLTKKAGYIKFVETGFEILSSSKSKANLAHCTSWLKNKASWINARYEVNQEISSDPSPQDTQIVYDLYVSHIFEKTGMVSVNYKEPKEYVNFVRAKKLADDIGISYEAYIDAQFEALDFCNGIPNLEDLYGEKGYTRVVRYVSKHGYVIKENKSNLNQNIWDQFKK